MLSREASRYVPLSLRQSFDYPLLYLIPLNGPTEEIDRSSTTETRNLYTEIIREIKNAVLITLKDSLVITTALSVINMPIDDDLYAAIDGLTIFDAFIPPQNQIELEKVGVVFIYQIRNKMFDESKLSPQVLESFNFILLMIDRVKKAFEKKRRLNGFINKEEHILRTNILDTLSDYSGVGPTRIKGEVFFNKPNISTEEEKELLKMRKALRDEFVQNDKDIINYDMYGVHINATSKDNVFSIEVPGVSDGRPTVNISDIVRMRFASLGPTLDDYNRLRQLGNLWPSSHGNIEIRAIVISVDRNLLTLLLPISMANRNDPIYNCTVLSLFAQGEIKNCMLEEVYYKDKPMKKLLSLVKFNLRFGFERSAFQYMLYALNNNNFSQIPSSLIEPELIYGQEWEQLTIIDKRDGREKHRHGILKKKWINKNEKKEYDEKPKLFNLLKDLNLIKFKVEEINKSGEVVVKEVENAEIVNQTFGYDVKSSWYNKEINAKQKAAVNNVLNHSSSPFPFIVFGPPGTGKTLFVMEAILQIINKYESTKALNSKPPTILLSCPSDSACDTIAMRLAKYLTPENMIRICNWKRKPEALPVSLLPFCPVDSRGYFMIPSLYKMSNSRVIICTCFTAAIIHARALPLEFSHIVIDEAAQAMIPEVCLALQFAKPDTNVVIAGDIKQLGPVIRHSISASILISLQEKLMNSVPYKDNLDSPYITILEQNYRSHKNILELPSKMFYENKLIACADSSLVDSMLPFEELGGNSCPILFYGIRGGYNSEGEGSGSYFNLQEAQKIVTLVKEILDSKNVTLLPSEIGVITPYRSQIVLIRKLLRNVNLGAIRVGTVDDYQGQEAKVIFISIVFALEELSNKHSRTGLLNNAKQFNVAITRAHALLVVVGNPYTLCQDPCWNQFLQYVIQRKNYRGCDFFINESKSNPFGLFKSKEVKSPLIEISSLPFSLQEDFHLQNILPFPPHSLSISQKKSLIEQLHKKKAELATLTQLDDKGSNSYVNGLSDRVSFSYTDTIRKEILVLEKSISTYNLDHKKEEDETSMKKVEERNWKADDDDDDDIDMVLKNITNLGLESDLLLDVQFRSWT